jgi:hypothetical protein
MLLLELGNGLLKERDALVDSFGFDRLQRLAKQS